MKEEPPQRAVRNQQRRHKVDRTGLTRFLERVAVATGNPDAGVTVALFGDARLHELNRDYRGMDKPTDVLSFRSNESDGYLGDIAISVETAERQAKRRKSRLDRELRVLILHGFLHLLGYDHETDDGEMRRVEYRLRRRFGITTPRTSAA